MSRGIFWLASYPKSGNTWFRVFIENLQRDAACPADINRLSIKNAANKFWLDDALGFSTADLREDEVEALRAPAYEWFASTQEAAGYFKIHDAYRPELLVAQRHYMLGALYLIRDPLDVALSLANHHGCDLDSAVSMMIDTQRTTSSGGSRYLAQARQYLSCWSGHAISWVDGLQVGCHVVRYEDLLATPMETFTRAARYLQLPDEPERIAKAISFSSFAELVRQEEHSGFRERNAPGARFFRRGRSGQGRQCLSRSQINRIVSAHGAVMERFGYLNHDREIGNDTAC